MRSQFLKIISLFYLLIIVHLQSTLALQNDSLQSILKNKLTKEVFNKEIDVIKYLDIANQMYSKSPTEALFYVNALEEKLELEKNNIGRGYILSQKGTFYWLQGIYDASLNADFAALKLFEEDNNTSEIFKILNNIGETYKKQKDYIQSAKFIQLALSKISENGEVTPELILVNLGQLFMLKKNYDSANYYFNLILNRDSVSSQSKGFAFLYKGIVNRETGQNDSAQYLLQQSLNYWNKINYSRGTVESKIEIGKVNLCQNNFSLANQILQEAENMALQINTLDLLLNIYQTKIDLFKVKGSKDSLVLYFNKYLEIKDSIFSSESRAEINKLSIQYNLAEKEKESYKLALEQSALSNKVEKRTQFLILLGLVLIFAIAFILYLKNKSNQLKNAHIKLKQQKNEIEDKQKKIKSKSLALAKVNNELHKLNQNLEKRVMERTQKLNERNRQIAEFTYYNSHKLRAPVANVLGLINVMELSQDGKIESLVLEHLKTSAMELDKVIYNLKNLLDLDEEIEK